MLPKNTLTVFGIPRAVVYYIPFCPRPTMTITLETLDKLNKVQVDEPLDKVKRDTHTKLVERFGQPITTCSPHLTPGAFFRSLCYSTPMTISMYDVNGGCALMFFLSFNVFYVLLTHLVLENELELSSRFKALCNE